MKQSSWQQRQKKVTASLNQFYQRPVSRVSLELLLSIGMVIFLLVAAIQPTLNTMTQLTKEINEKKEIDAALPKKIASLNTAQTEYLQVQDQLPLLDEAIPEVVEIVRYLKIIEYEASRHHLIISTLSVSSNGLTQNETRSSDNTSNKQLVNVNLSVDGSYQDIKNFILALESSRATFLVNSVSFSVKKVHAKEHLVSSINLSIPYYSTQQTKQRGQS